VRGVPRAKQRPIPPGPGGNLAPADVGEPLITGTVASGAKLTATTGSWTNAPTGYQYAWRDCGLDGGSCSIIPGANASTYTVAPADAGHTIDVVVTASNSMGSTSAAAPAVPLVDDFTADRTVDQNVWDEMSQQGDTSNHEVECYLPHQLGLGAAGLEETAAYVPGGFTCPSGTPDATNPLNWESGAVQMRSVNFTYGTIVARAKMAGGTGAWPAIWLLGAACQQPNWLTAGPGSTGFSCPWPADSADAAEIDIAEDLGSNGSSTINENVFNSSSNVSSSCTYDTGSDLAGTFHDYELDWSPGSLVFKVDGKTTSCGISKGVPSRPMFLIIDTAICTASSSCGGTTNPATFPQTTTIAWVRISH
jgi:hypothetical protein